MRSAAVSWEILFRLYLVLKEDEENGTSQTAVCTTRETRERDQRQAMDIVQREDRECKRIKREQ